MDELIFFGVIIAFSILDSIVRGKKKGQKGTDGIPIPEAQAWEPAEVEAYQPTYDEEPSYDDERRVSGLEANRQYAEPPLTEPELAIPKDLWEEIAALAGGRLPVDQAPEPEVNLPFVVEPQLPVDPSESERARRRALRAQPARRVERSIGRTKEHRVHGSHRGYGTDPSSRAPSEQDDLDPLAETLSRDAATARALLQGHDMHSLRQAIILQELLGPPAAFRE